MALYHFAEVNLDRLVIHKVGNRSKNEGLAVARELCKLDGAGDPELLLKYFLTPFKGDTLYRFYHETDLHLNEMYMYTSRIFLDKSSFYEQSINVLKHLYEKSDHPQIKSGEFYLAYLTGLRFGEESVDAIGIFKSENKDLFLQVMQNRSDFDLTFAEGINIKKLDKGCLIFNVGSQDGYRVCIVDGAKKKDEEAAYWKDEFLRVAEIQDDNFRTRTTLNLCRNFCEDIYGQVYQADRKEQAAFINKALDYFTNNSEFEVEHFAAQVMEDPQQAEDFKSYTRDYEESNGLPVRQGFSIAPKTVKTMKRKFKNLIKLDTEIEIKINPTPVETDNTRFIERGYDAEKGMYYYKLYFHEET